MENTTYPAPLDTLLTFGSAETENIKDWPNHLTPGITSDHIPDLIRMTTDHNLRYKYFDDDAYPDFNEDEHPEYWAPIHALHTLGALHAASASKPLLSMFDEAIKVNDDWILEDLPEAYGMFGSSAIPPLVAYIAEPSHNEYARGYAVEALNRIAAQHSNTHDEVGKALTTQLEHFEENGEGLNATIIDALVKLHYMEAVPVIERAFAADKVDTLFMGDWDDVQVQLGLQTTQQLDDKRRQQWAEEVAQREKEYPFEAVASDPHSTPSRHIKQSAKKKAKAKMAKASRKKNQRKK